MYVPVVVVVVVTGESEETDDDDEISTKQHTNERTKNVKKWCASTTKIPRDATTTTTTTKRTRGHSRVRTDDDAVRVFARDDGRPGFRCLLFHLCVSQQ